MEMVGERTDHAVHIGHVTALPTSMRNRFFDAVPNLHILINLLIFDWTDAIIQRVELGRDKIDA